jgi:hypothetical protein
MVALNTLTVRELKAIATIGAFVLMRCDGENAR